MMQHRDTVVGLGDGGAHCGVICDASFSAFMLSHWVRDRSRGERVPLEWAVKAITRDPAATVGLHDRGVIRSEEHTSELQSLMRISYAVSCLKKKNTNTQ